MVATLAGLDRGAIGALCAQFRISLALRPGYARQHSTRGPPLLSKDQDWVARARELAPLLEAAASRTEQERKIPADVIAAMHDARLFHILLPASLGGAAADLVTYNQVVETLAAADASPAWCLAQALASTHAAGFLDHEIAGEVFATADALVAWGPPAGVAKAIAVDGGYRISGRW